MSSRKLRIALAAIMLFALGACGNKGLTEAEQYERLKQSLVYKTYKATSQTAMPALIWQLNTAARSQPAKQVLAEPEHKLTPLDGHLLLALSWVLSTKPDYAIAESNTVLEMIPGLGEKDYPALADDRLASEKALNYVGSSLLALALYQKNWKTLAQETSRAAHDALQDKQLAKQMHEVQVTIYLATGLLALQENDLQRARVSFAGLGTLTGITWLSEAIEACILLREGKLQQGLQRLKALADDPSLPERERLYVRGLIESIEAERGGMDGNFFIIKALGKVIIERISATDTSRFREAISKLEELKKKLTPKESPANDGSA